MSLSAQSHRDAGEREESEVDKRLSGGMKGDGGEKLRWEWDPYQIFSVASGRRSVQASVGPHACV